ncbi:MAG: outer membrane protein assembly factor BamD [Candidatus Omnitrophica bacterium]|nr:outer membrane protein assembly factor BamD [Candidatus Omnitrophota bacterium]
MKKEFFCRSIAIAAVALLFLFSNTALAYWVWTPGTKKFINPKNAVKDTPKEQFEWAMTFYNSKDFQRAATEFEKLTKQYEYSEYASKSQYYVGLCYESMNKFFIAYQNYQKAIDNFPHIENLDEIVAREFNIANMFMVKESPKVLGADILTSLDRAIEIYKKVVENAPYGRLADEAQFRMGLATKKAERYDEAIQAFQKILDDYPTSTFVDKAKFEVADCAYKASLKPAYDVEPTQKAIRAFEDFSRENRDRSLSKEADKTIQRLKDKASEKSLLTAQFYEKQGRYQAAIIYYKDILSTYPESSYVDLANSKISALTERLERKTSPFSLKFVKSQKSAKKDSTGEEVTKKKAWAPFSFKKQAKTADAAEDAKPKSQPVKMWNPFAKKAKAETVSTETESANVEGANPAKKAWAPFSFDKPKKTGEPVVTQEQEKPKSQPVKMWNPFVKKAKAETVSTEAESAKPTKKPWTPLSFDKSEKVEAAPISQEESVAAYKEPKPKSQPVKMWNPFAKKARVETVSTETESANVEGAKPAKKAWAPFSFDKPKKTGEPVVTQEQEKPKSQPVKMWNPFAKKAKAEAVSTEESKKSKSSGMKLWNPFTKKAKTQELIKEEAPVISETPIVSEAPAVSETPVTPEASTASAPQITPEAQPAEKEAVVVADTTTGATEVAAETPEIKKTKEEIVIPAQGSGEEPSQIRLTTNEDDVKPATPPVQDETVAKDDNPEDEIERSEYF